MAKAKNPFWKSTFTSFPAWTCPFCHEATVKASKDDIVERETQSSKSAHSHDAWDPEWISLRFSAFLHCQDVTCGETIVASGTAKYVHCYWDNHEGYQEEYVTDYNVMSIVPGPPIFIVKEFVPAIIAEHLSEIFTLFWVSPSASINRLRVCLEDLLTQQKIIRYITKNGKRNSLTLHARIERFSEKNVDASDSLLALKWIGNSGSHASEKGKITREHVIEAMGIFEHALDQIYNTKGKVMKRKINNINAKKGF